MNPFTSTLLGPDRQPWVHGKGKTQQSVCIEIYDIFSAAKLPLSNLV